MSILIDLTVGESYTSIQYRGLYAPLHLPSLKGAPSATAQDAVLRKRPRLVTLLDDSHVSLISLAQETSLTDSKQLSRVVSHELYEAFH